MVLQNGNDLKKWFNNVNTLGALGEMGSTEANKKADSLLNGECMFTFWTIERIRN
jgi:hypothetical protein